VLIGILKTPADWPATAKQQVLIVLFCTCDSNNYTCPSPLITLLNEDNYFNDELLGKMTEKRSFIHNYEISVYINSDSVAFKTVSWSQQLKINFIKLHLTRY